MKKTFNFGKIKYTNQKKATNLVTIDVELRHWGGKNIFTIDRKTGEKTVTGKTPEYMELSICGNIWNPRCSDIVCGGQCVDTIAKYKEQLEDKEVF